jgi:hypothetical protein
MILLFLLCVVAGCGSIPQDSTPAPIDYNQYSLELDSCGKRDVGLLGCYYDPSNIKGSLWVPMGHKGEIQISSNRCNFFLNKRFTVNEKLSYEYSQLLANADKAENSCLFDIKVFVDGMDKGLRGQFLLQKKEFASTNFTWMKQEFLGLGQFQIKEGSSIRSALVFKADEPGFIFWKGCELEGDKRFEKNPELFINEILEGYLVIEKSCVLTVGIVPDNKDAPVMLNKINIQIFGKPLVSMVDPTFKYKKGKLYVTADRMTAIMKLGEKYYVKKGTRIKKAKIKVKKDEAIYIGIGTSNGRYSLYKVKNGVVIWKNFIRL